MITKKEQSKLRSTIALLSSMVNSGEQHSEQSKKEVSEALSIVNNFSIHDVSNQLFCPRCGAKNWDRENGKKHCLECEKYW